MSSFYDNNVTDVGRLLLGDIQMGASFVPTKIVIGKGYMPAGKTTRTMTDVAEVVKELQLNKAMKNPNGDAIFGAIFTNEDIQQAFYYRELAMYAKGVYFNAEGGVERETEEVLYSYGNAGDNAELIPAYGIGTVVERQLDLLVYIGNDTQVSLTVETGLYVTIPVFNDTVDELRQEIEEVRYIVDSGDLKKYQWEMTNGTLSLDAVDGSSKVNIADKETLDATKAVVDTINTNTSGLSTKIGETADKGGSSTAGSAFAKLNKIISDIAAHVAQWTAARAAKIDSIDTNSATASTKATEAANYGNEIKTQVAVNNTPSKTGTLSQKATQIIEDVEELNTGMGDVNVKLQDVAQQTTVKEINNKIGTESDADTQPTLFGRLAQLKNVLVEKLAEVITNITGIDNKIGTSSDTSEDETLFGKLESVSKSTRDMILVPSDNLKITVLDNEELQSEATSDNRVFIGYVRFNKSGFVRSKVNMKSLYNGESMSVLLSFFDGVYRDRTARSSIATLPVKGDKTSGSGSFGEQNINFSLGSNRSNQYSTVIMHPYVVKDQLYAVVLYSGNRGGAVNSVKFYYDEVEGGNHYDSMP